MIKKIFCIRFLYLSLLSIFFISNSVFNSSFAETLTVKHLDQNWDSKSIPQKGVCLRRGGEGFSPKIEISMIPENAKVIKLMFTDMDYGKEGGHGGIEKKINGQKVLVVPSFRDNLPKGFIGIKKHHCKKCKKIGGNDFYNGPCSPKRKHTYKVFVYANDDNGKIISKGSLTLGKY